jgi:hypothetical protein
VDRAIDMMEERAQEDCMAGVDAICYCLRALEFRLDRLLELTEKSIEATERAAQDRAAQLDELRVIVANIGRPPWAPKEE